MKVLIVTCIYSSQKSGKKRPYIIEQVEALQKKGIEVDILNINIVNSILKYLVGFFLVFFKTFFTKYDIVHAHYGLTGACSISRVRAPLITTFHGSDVNLKWQRIISKIAYIFGNESIFVSPTLYKLLNANSGTIIPCGLDLNFFKPYPKLKARTELNFPDNKKIIVFPGSVKDKAKNYKLFKETIHFLNNYDIFEIILNGYTRKEVVKILNASDVLLMTSITEGSPVIIKEALACNLPVVSVDVGDVRKIIEGINGCYICKHNPNELAQAVKNASNIKDFNSREYVKHYDNSIIADKLINLYNRLNSRNY